MMNYSACAFLIDVTGNSADFWTLINPNDVIENPQFTNPGNDDFHSPTGKGAYAGPDPLVDADIPPFD
jgi:hypothetical protein